MQKIESYVEDKQEFHPDAEHNDKEKKNTERGKNLYGWRKHPNTRMISSLSQETSTSKLEVILLKECQRRTFPGIE